MCPTFVLLFWLRRNVGILLDLLLDHVVMSWMTSGTALESLKCTLTRIDDGLVVWCYDVRKDAAA